VAVGSMLNRTCGVSIAGVAQASNVDRPGMSMSMSTDMVPGLVASSNFNPERAGCSRSVQVCVVDVDVESDQVDIVGWAIGHDRGRVVSPLLVEGQALGSIAHGLSNALCEEARAADGATDGATPAA
jgi:carbon-monoxide dehydrogenase large subunit